MPRIEAIWPVDWALEGVISLMDVTIFIRTKNEERLLPRCLEGLFSQKTNVEFNVIALDSGSEDNTLSILTEYAVTVYEIPAKLFGYSWALNFGVQKSSGSLFVALSGHCVPYDEHWLEELVQPVIRNSSIAASYSRQIPWPDVSRPEREEIQATFPETESLLDEASFDKAVAAGSEPYRLLKFSNAASCIRRELLIERPFLELPFSEDRAFAYDCLRGGGDLFYAAQSVIYHSHSPCLASFRRIAMNAEISRAQINAMVAVDRSVSSIPSSSSPLKAYLKLPLMILYAAAVSLWGLLTLYPLRCGWGNYRRFVRYYVASIGTTLGKIDAARRVGDYVGEELLPADPGVLLHEARVR